MPPWNSHSFGKINERKLHRHVNYREIIADDLSKSGWSWGCVSGVNSKGRIFFCSHPQWLACKKRLGFGKQCQAV